MAFELTVQLVGPSWGPEVRHTSASVRRRLAAARRVQEEFRRRGSCCDCAPVDVRQALAARGMAFRRSAEHAELVALVERCMPVVADETEEVDSIKCSATADWMAADVRAAVAKACGVASMRLRCLYVHNALAPETATFNELAVGEGARVQLVVSNADEEPAQSRRAKSPVDAVMRQRARDEKKKHVAAVRAMLASGEKHQQHGEWRAAADCYSQAIIASHADDPALQGPLSNRGLCHSRMNEWRNAWKDHNRALELASSMHSRTLHYLNRGQCALRLGMLEESHDDFEMAALHASTKIVSNTAAKQLQRLKKPLRTAFEGHLAWLREYYPSIAAAECCSSVESFQALCKETRDTLARQFTNHSKSEPQQPLGQRHDRYALVHKRALETVCNEQDIEPAPVAEGARAEFSRILKHESRALLIADAAEDMESEQSGQAEVETLYDSETREVLENKERWIASQNSMVGNVANGFVLMRERKAIDAIYAIKHRVKSDGTGIASNNDIRAARESVRAQSRPATAPASNTRSRPSSADTIGLQSTVSVGSAGITRRSRRGVRRDRSLEATFRHMLPTTVAIDQSSENGSDGEHQEEGKIDNRNGGGEDRDCSTSEQAFHARRSSVLSQKQKQKFLAQQRSAARLSNPAGAKTEAVPKVMVGGVAMQTPAQMQATARKMKSCRRETRRRLLRGELWLVNGDKGATGTACRGGDGWSTPSAGQLYDTVSYREKTKQHGGPPGTMCRGKATRVAQMDLVPDAVSMESLLGDWTKAEAAAHFFSKCRPGSLNDGRPQSADSVRGHLDSTGGGSAQQDSTTGLGTQWSAWSAFQYELSYRLCEEEKSGGTRTGSSLGFLTMRGCNAGMLTVPRFLQTP